MNTGVYLVLVGLGRTAHWSLSELKISFKVCSDCFYGKISISPSFLDEFYPSSYNVGEFSNLKPPFWILEPHTNLPQRIFLPHAHRIANVVIS